MHGLVLLFAILTSLVGLSCAAPAATPKVASASSGDADATALAQVALDAIERRGCALLVAQTFPIADSVTKLSTGRVWPRKCTARRMGKSLHVEAEIVGWQWVSQQSSGFAVRDYVYFQARVSAELAADVSIKDGHVVLRLHATDPAKVQVAALSEVRAHASNPAALLMGIATGIVGLGPNTLATNALRGKVRDVFMERSKSGFEVIVDDPSLTTNAPAMGTAGEWLNETQGLNPLGALLSGGFPPGIASKLDYEIEGEGVVLARPVCIDEAAATIDTFLADKPQPVAQPAGVIELRHSGKASFPALACRWLLVTAVRDDVAATAKLHLGPTVPRDDTWGEKRWVRATLTAFSIEHEDPNGQSWDPPGGAPDLLFTIGPPGHQSRFGAALPNVFSASPWLVSPLFELRETDVLELRVSDLDPKPRSWLSTGTDYEEQLVGEGRIASSALLDGKEITVPVVRDGKKTGWARMRFTSVRVDP